MTKLYKLFISLLGKPSARERYRTLNLAQKEPRQGFHTNLMIKLNFPISLLVKLI